VIKSPLKGHHLHDRPSRCKEKKEDFKSKKNGGGWTGKTGAAQCPWNKKTRGWENLGEERETEKSRRAMGTHCNLAVKTTFAVGFREGQRGPRGGGSFKEREDCAKV